MRSNPQETADLVTFTEKILDGKLHFLCSVSKSSVSRELALSDQGFGVIRKSSWSLHIAFEKSWKRFLILNFNKNLFLYYFSQSWSLLWFLMIVSNILPFKILLVENLTQLFKIPDFKILVKFDSLIYIAAKHLVEVKQWDFFALFCGTFVVIKKN